MSCQFPGGANSLDEFWQLLLDGKDAVTEIPEDRWDADSYYHPDYTIRGKINVKWGGFVDNVDMFDAQFFSIPPMEALRLDPQQRMLLENTYQALEDAGMDVNKLNGENVGVFVGLSAHDYGDICMHPSEHVNIDGKTISGGSASIASNRISYVFNFRGPSYSIDTACSSSLIAVHNACRSIWNDECPMAVVGGVNSLIKPEITMSFSTGGFLSPNGRCRTFDADADGYIRSEGAGVLILKPLSQAVKDGDKIYTTIISSAINQDGQTDGISMPSQDAQIAVFEEAYKRAHIDPGKVQYVEAHGTGTAVGDPIEATSLGMFIGSKKKNGEKLVIGSVKSNLGHLEPASGVAGLIKLSLAMHKEQIPKNIHFKKPNPKIDFKKYNLEVPTTLIDWPNAKGKDMYAGINSFGFGGANAHVVLQGYEQKNGKTKTVTEKKKANPDRPEIFTLSARNSNALKEYAKNYIDYLENNPDASLYDICYTVNNKRSHHYHRLAFVVHSKEELAEQLKAYLDGETRPGMSVDRASMSEVKPKVAFVCSGQGPQWWGMARELYEKEPVFRKVIEDTDKIIKTLTNEWSLIEEMMKDEANSRISETNIAQPTLFAVQVGLAKMWESMGVKPDAIVGHSIGEVAAGYISGVFTFEQAVKVIFHRSDVQQQASGKGKMLAVGLTEDEAAKLIVGNEDKVSVATINGPNLVTLSGEEGVLTKIAEDLDKKDIFHRFLVVKVPFHSPYMEPLKDDLLKALKDIELQDEQIPLYSTVTGGRADKVKFDANYWYKNVRESVRFTSATESIINDGYTVFVELSPHPILSRYIDEMFEKTNKKGKVVASIRRKEEDMLNLLGNLGKLHTWGYPIDFKNLYEEGNFIELPKYPFQRERFWIETKEGRETRIGKKYHPFIKKHIESARSDNDHMWDIVLDKRMLPWIDDHRVQGPIVFPGAGSTEMTLACAKNAFGDDFCYIEDIQFKKALFLPDEGDPPEIQLNVSTDDGSYSIYSRKNKNDSWTRHVLGKIRHHEEKFEHEEIKLEDVKKRVTEKVNIQPLYDELFSCGLQLGDTFRGITKLWRNDTESGLGESYGEIVVPESIRTNIDHYNIHPSILDASFQCLFGSEKREEGKPIGVMVPVNIKKIKFYRKPTLKLYSYGRVEEAKGIFVTGKLWVFDEDGNLCIEIQGFKCRYIEGTRGEDQSNVDNTFYKWDWKLKERATQRRLRKPGEYLPDPTDIEEFSKEVIKEIQERPERRLHDETFEPLLNQITADYITQAFRNLGFDFDIGETFTSDEFIEKYNIIDKHKKLVKRCMEIIAENGTLESVGDKWKVVEKPTERNLEKAHNDLMREYPDFKHELIMLMRCAPYLAEIFEGTADAVQLLFPEEEWDAIIKYYQESYSFKKYNDIVKSTMKELLKDLPKDQTLRILEVGAGTGGMTSVVLPVLPKNRTEYFFTDLSYMFMVKAQDRFGSDYPFLEFKTLDITKDLEEQGIDPHSFDIVIASDVLHATPSIKETLSNVHKLLAPKGILTMLEVTQSPWYPDLIFGLTEGWWMFEDYELRPNHPSLSVEKWKKVLNELGFTNVLALTEATDDKVAAQTVFYSRNKDFAIEDKKISLPDKYSKEAGNWLIFKDDKGVADKIATKVGNLGENCIIVEAGSDYSKKDDNNFVVDPLKEEHISKVFDVIESSSKPLHGIVHCWNINHPEMEGMTAKQLDDTYALGCTSVLALVRQLYRKDDPSKDVHLWIVTSGATNVNNTKAISLSQASVWGLGRSLIHEYQNLDTTLIDIGRDKTDDDINSLFEEICMEEQAEEVSLRGKIRYLHKFSSVTAEDEERASMKKVASENHPYHLVIKEHGILDNLYLQEMERQPLGKDEVEIQTKATGLNFKDVMIAMGMLHEDAPKGGYTGKNLGMECSGVISAVGDDVTEFKPGDEVIAISSDSFSSLVKTKADFVVKKPSEMSFEEGATIPFAYITAYYSLVYCGRMRKGERVLIHSASGGVGIAGVRIAQQIGAEVFATAGSPERKEFLRNMGVKHIMDSRSLSFADEIMEATNGEGVDIVLNSLSGSAIYKSVSILRRYGRFVEIGKTDIYENNQLNLRPFGNNLSYFAVDIDKLLTERPKLCGELIREFMSMFGKEGHPPAHPYQEFPMSRIVDAFNFMAHAKHIGKVIVKNNWQDLTVAPSTDVRTELKDDATYINVGGFSGLGLEISKWLVEKGVKNLVVMSRSGAKTDEAKEALKQMKEAGCNVLEAKVDVSDEDAMSKTLNDIKKNMPPIKGIIHGAMVLDDAIVNDMTHDRFMTAVRPKALGGWNLHKHTLDCDLDFFVSFSSVACEYGTPAQTNYSAGNAFLDMLAHHRQNEGRQGSTVSWGVIGQVGFVARTESVNNILSSQGWNSYTPEQALDALAKVILRKPDHRAAIDADWSKVAQYFPKDKTSHRYAELLKETEESAKGGMSLKDTILETEPEKRQELLQSQVAERIARILGTSASKIDLDDPISNMGLDSLMANQLRNWIHLKLDVDFSMMKIMRGPSVTELTKQLLDEIGTGGGVTVKSQDVKHQEKTDLEKWIIVRKPRPNAKMRLFCLPYMAGGASSFLGWADLLPDTVEVCAIQYPGREERTDEEPFNEVNELVKEMAKVMLPLLDKPFAFYGHSIGAGIGYKLAHYLQKEHNKKPEMFFAAGWIAPHLRSPFKIIEKLTEDEIMSDAGWEQLIQHMRNLEISENILQNKKLMNEMMPSIRADILIGKRYQYVEKEPLHCPITAFAGEKDSVFTLEQVRGWKEHTDKGFDFIVISGGHLFLREDKETLLKNISEKLVTHTLV